METILVTGGAGFIGANFVCHYLKTGSGRVVNLEKLTYAGNPENLTTLKNNPRHIFVHGDIGDRHLLDRLLSQYAPTALINFAAESHVDRSIHGPEDFIQTNVVGTFHLLESVRAYWSQLKTNRQQTFRFLHVSTDEVYGSLNAGAPAFTETHPYAPNSPYAASKAASDHLVRSYHHTYGLPTLTSNCSNNYGPYQFPEKLIPLMIINALTGKRLPIYGDGKNIRDWLYVGDHCKAIEAVLKKGKAGEVYNIGGNNEKTNIEIVQSICSILNDCVPDSIHHPHEQLITYVPDRVGHDRRYAIDATKIKNELGWTPAETFDSGIQHTVRWYLENPNWIKHITTGSYQDWIHKNYGMNDKDGARV